MINIFLFVLVFFKLFLILQQVTKYVSRSRSKQDENEGIFYFSLLLFVFNHVKIVFSSSYGHMMFALHVKILYE